MLVALKWGGDITDGVYIILISLLVRLGLGVVVMSVFAASLVFFFV